MKTIIASIFLFFNVIVLSQTSDLIILPKENTLVGTLHYPTSMIGIYCGGYFITQYRYPVYYTTPLTFFNRLGITFGTNKISLMGGGFFDLTTSEIKLRPDVWIKINPIRILSGSDTAFDFSLALNYATTLNYGVGISIIYR